MAVTKKRELAQRRRTSALALAGSEAYAFKRKERPPRTSARIEVVEPDDPRAGDSRFNALVLATKAQHPTLDLPSEPSRDDGGIDYPFEWVVGNNIVVVSLRCLSVKYPWISLIGRGKKPFELRKSKTLYRGPIILCSSAARSKTKDALAWPEEDGPKGVALCVADLVGCRPATAADAKGACCKPQEGEWVWEMENVRKLAQPVPVKGSLGLYKPTRKVLEAALAVLNVRT